MRAIARLLVVIAFICVAPGVASMLVLCVGGALAVALAVPVLFLVLLDVIQYDALRGFLAGGTYWLSWLFGVGTVSALVYWLLMRVAAFIDPSLSGTTNPFKPERAE